MELKDLTDSSDFLSPQCFLDSSSSSSSSSPPSSPASFLFSSSLASSFLLDPTPARSSHPGFLLPSPACSSSSSISHGGGSEPDSPTGSGSGRGSVGGGAEASEAGLQFPLAPSGSFSSQVHSVLRGDYLTRMGAAGPKRLCLVCGDLASGFHYGVASCEACKAFFKRTIQGNMDYSCPARSQCEVTKRRRKACQACRFQKCLQAGMMREGVRLDRVRGGRQKYKRQMETGPGSCTRTSYCVSSRTRVITQLLLTEPPPLAANHEESTGDGSLRTLLTLCDLLNRELLVLISWAKQIPGFAGLSLLDQMALLQSGWMEALLVGVASRSQTGQELVFAGNLRLDQGQCRNLGLGDLYQAVRHLTARYQAMKLSPEEVVALKAMALANSDADPVDCLDSVQRFQDGLHEALQEYEASRREQHRVGRLLMSLPLLRQTADRAVQVFLRLNRHQNLPLHKLLLEMLDAKA